MGDFRRFRCSAERGQAQLDEPRRSKPGRYPSATSCGSRPASTLRTGNHERRRPERRRSLSPRPGREGVQVELYAVQYRSEDRLGGRDKVGAVVMRVARPSLDAPMVPRLFERAGRWAKPSGRAPGGSGSGPPDGEAGDVAVWRVGSARLPSPWLVVPAAGGSAGWNARPNRRSRTAR